MKSEALRAALEVHKIYDQLNNKAKRSAINRLAAFGFASLDLVTITGASLNYVHTVTGKPKLGATPWRIDTLDVLAIIAKNNEAGYPVSPVLVKSIVQHGTPLRSIARLTGIPLEELRSVL